MISIRNKKNEKADPTIRKMKGPLRWLRVSFLRSSSLFLRWACLSSLHDESICLTVVIIIRVLKEIIKGK